MSTWMILRRGAVGRRPRRDFSVLQRPPEFSAKRCGVHMTRGRESHKVRDVERPSDAKQSGYELWDLRAARFASAGHILLKGARHEHPRISGQGAAREVRRSGPGRLCRDERRRSGRGRARSSPGRCGSSRRRSTPAAAARASSRSSGRDAKGGVRLAHSIDEVREHAAEMLGKTLVTVQTGPAGKQVQRLYITDGVDIAKEYLPRAAGRPRERPHRRRRLDRRRHGDREGRPRHAREDRAPSPSIRRPA